jgi:hypothetical protein
LTDSSTDKTRQSEFAFTPEYENYAGVEHEFTGTLFVPTAREEAKQAEAAKPEMMSVVGSKPVLFVAPSEIVRLGHSGKKVKMNALDALKLRAKE